MLNRHLSVSEAAAFLGVGHQRIHQRIQDGSLPAEKVGRQYVIAMSDLLGLRGDRSPGRPFSARSAWSLAIVASRDPGLRDLLNPPERSRANSRLREIAKIVSARPDDLDAATHVLSRALRLRAQRLTFKASPHDLPELREDPRFIESGVSLPEASIAAGDLAEGYTLASGLDDMVNEYLLTPVPSRTANVIIHSVGAVPGAPVSHSLLENVVRSWVVLAADLAEHDGVREKNQAMRTVQAWVAADRGAQ